MDIVSTDRDRRCGRIWKEHVSMEQLNGPRNVKKVGVCLLLIFFRTMFYHWYLFLMKQETLELNCYLANKSINGNKNFRPIKTDRQLKLIMGRYHSLIYIYRTTEGKWSYCTHCHTLNESLVGDFRCRLYIIVHIIL
jgi:hypothetical protein